MARLERSREAGPAANRYRRRPMSGFRRHPMKSRQRKTNDEPMGIVIAGMPNTPAVPVFSAFEWAPAPSTVEDEPKAS